MQTYYVVVGYRNATGDKRTFTVTVSAPNIAEACQAAAEETCRHKTRRVDEIVDIDARLRVA